MAIVFLVGGVSRSGKSTFCMSAEASNIGLTHLPLDSYILPAPAGLSFADWLAHPGCIAWQVVFSHLTVLDAGSPCYCPVPNWSKRSEPWVSAGGITPGKGQMLRPAALGYLVEGTQAFAFRGEVAARLYVASPDAIVAERLTGVPRTPSAAAEVLRRRLASNLPLLRAQRGEADLVIDGTAPRAAQIAALRALMARLRLDAT